MHLDGAVMSMLSGAVNGQAAPAFAGAMPGPSTQSFGHFNNIHSLPGPMRAQAAAMLMSSVPVLAQTMRQQAMQTAALTVQAASSLVDLSMSEADDGLLADAMDVDAAMEPEATVGAAAMVGAAAAALALTRLRR
jgi:hypothetical protein